MSVSPHAVLACLVVLPAQTKSETEQVVAITESVGYEIDPTERDEYGLFPHIPGFLKAEVVGREGQFWLRISYRRGVERLVEQTTLTEAELRSMRDQIEAHDAAVRTGAHRPAATEAEKEGRLRLVTDVFLYGLWLYGPGAITLLDLEENAAAGVQLLVAGGSFAGGLSATNDYRLGYARTRLVRWGNFAGTFYGLGIPALLEVDNVKVYAASAMAMTPLGGYLARGLGASRHFAKGEADLITTGTWVGSLYGFCIPYLIDISGMRDSIEWRVYLASGMAGVPAGTMVAAQLTRGRQISRGRAHLITLGGLLGTVDALTLVDLVDDGVHPRLYVLSAMAGLPLGAYMGYRSTESEEYTLGRSRLISLGAYAGAIVGNGLLFTAGIDDEKALRVSMVVGSAAGAWFTHRATQGWGERVTRLPEPSPDAVSVSWPTPTTLLTLGMLARHGSPGGQVPPVELVRVTF